MLPKPVQDCPEAMEFLDLLGDLDWEHFPERRTNRKGTPASDTLPPLHKGEYYWGYASGVTVTKIDGLALFD